MKRTISVILAIIIQIMHAEIYNDRILIYIENDIDDLILDDEGYRTNNSELNSELDRIDASLMFQWLPNARSTDRDGDIYLNRYYEIQLANPHSNITSLSKEVESLECIRTAEVIGVVRPDYVPNDSYWNTQYEMTLIKADSAYGLWDIDGGEIPGQIEDGEIVVAVVDVGLDWDHPDLIGNIWQNLGEDADGDGVVLVQSGNTWIFDPDDENGIDDDEDGYEDNFLGWDVGQGDNNPVPFNSYYEHGTNVAGNVSASTNNGMGLASTGWSVKMMGINVASGNDATMWTSDCYQGVLAAAQMGARVINCSWGSFGGGGNQSVINNAYNSYGCVIVASSGNGGDDGNTNFQIHYPSSHANVISVSAIGPNDNFGCWATAGSTVDLCAPGEAIVTTAPNGGYSLNTWGTSFASPITAGAVALVWSKFSDLENSDIEDRILSNTDYFSDMDGSCQGTSLEGMLGTGRLNVYKALSAGIYPGLYISEVNYLNDSDEDGVFNPGEQVQVKLIVGNQAGMADAENVVATISTDDDRIAILDNEIAFSNVIPAGGTSFTLLDNFLIYAFEDSELGNIPCTVNLQASDDNNLFEFEFEIEISLSLDQYGFPIEGMVVKSSPIVGDFDGNSLSEIYYGSDNGNIYGYMVAGIEQYGFPFAAGDDIRSSIAVGDVDDDGMNELVFGANNGFLYILNPFGMQEELYTQGSSGSGSIVGSPALIDLDLDGDSEIVFTTYAGNSGKVYAIHHNGDDVEGFPVNLNEKMLAGAAVGDLENDGNPDIVVVTWDDNVYAIDNSGIIKDGFPFISTNRFNSPPTLVDIDVDGDLEIIVGNDSGLLHVLHHDGSEMVSFDTGDDIRGGISVADMDDDGSFELLFTGYDDMIHVWNPVLNQELEGWPYDMGSNSLTEPVTADLDNDGDLEIVCARKNGMVYILHHDATPFNSFPTSVNGNIESSPAIGDLDGDGDFEVIFGTTSGLKVFDIKSNAGQRESWKLHRGNNNRSGSIAMTLVEVSNNDDILPDEFFVSANYPNPFNPKTQLDIHLSYRDNLIVTIFDATGRVINTLINKKLNPGIYNLEWNGDDSNGHGMPTGVYFIQVRSGSHVNTQKMILIK